MLRKPSKKCSFNLGIFLNRSDPPPPPQFLENLGHFFIGKFLLENLGHFSVGSFLLELFGHFFVLRINQKIGEKIAQKLLDLVKPPPPFCTPNSKLVGAQKMPQNFWMRLDPPPHTRAGWFQWNILKTFRSVCTIQHLSHLPIRVWYAILWNFSGSVRSGTHALICVENWIFINYKSIDGNKNL